MTDLLKFIGVIFIMIVLFIVAVWCISWAVSYLPWPEGMWY